MLNQDTCPRTLPACVKKGDIAHIASSATSQKHSLQLSICGDVPPFLSPLFLAGDGPIQEAGICYCKGASEALKKRAKPGV